MQAMRAQRQWTRWLPDAGNPRQWTPAVIATGPGACAAKLSAVVGASAAIAPSVMALRGGEVVDLGDDLLRAAGFGDVERVLTVDDDQRNALHLVALGELL